MVEPAAARRVAAYLEHLAEDRELCARILTQDAKG